MASRFTDTKIWEEDWFIEMPIEYQHLWSYVKDNCDHAGIWKPNKSGFEIRSKIKVNLDSFLEKANKDKERILRLRDGNWFLTGFIKFQWFNKKESFDLVSTNRLHLSIIHQLKKYSVPYAKVRGLKEVFETSKDLDKGRDKGLDLKKEKGVEFFGEKSKLFVTVKAVYVHEYPKVIYDLTVYFEAMKQLLGIMDAGWTDFEGFMKANPSAVYDDDNHLYRAFKKHCTTKKPNGKKVKFEDV
jgi:hypothetical protein